MQVQLRSLQAGHHSVTTAPSVSGQTSIRKGGGEAEQFSVATLQDLWTRTDLFLFLSLPFPASGGDLGLWPGEKSDSSFPPNLS